MTATLDRPTRRTSGRRRRRRRELTRNLLIGAVVIAGIAGFLVAQEILSNEPPRTLTVVAFEPRDDSADAAGELDAQIDRAIDRSGGLLVAAILDDRAGVVGDASFACDPGGNRLACENHRSEQTEQANRALEELLSASAFPTVAPFSPLRQVEAWLVGDDSPPDDIELILNLTARHTGSLDPDGLGADGRVDELVAEVAASGELPESCDDWQVHVVAPRSGDARQDRAWTEVYRGAVETCGGHLVRFVDRWPTPGSISTLPPPPELDTDEASVERDVEERTDTYSLEQTLFDVGSATLRPGAGQILDTIANNIAGLEGGWRIDVIGTADSVGDDEMNLALSTDRADNVADELVTRVVAAAGDTTATDDLAERFHVEGIGSLPDDGSEEERQRNRRVDIIVHHATSDRAS